MNRQQIKNKPEMVAGIAGLLFAISALLYIIKDRSPTLPELWWSSICGNFTFHPFNAALYVLGFVALVSLSIGLFCRKQFMVGLSVGIYTLTLLISIIVSILDPVVLTASPVPYYFFVADNEIIGKVWEFVYLISWTVILIVVVRSDTPKGYYKIAVAGLSLVFLIGSVLAANCYVVAWHFVKYNIWFIIQSVATIVGVCFMEKVTFVKKTEHVSQNKFVVEKNESDYNDAIEKIIKLNKLLEMGAITQEEFDKMKRQLLGL